MLEKKKKLIAFVDHVKQKKKTKAEAVQCLEFF